MSPSVVAKKNYISFKKIIREKKNFLKIYLIKYIKTFLIFFLF